MTERTRPEIRVLMLEDDPADAALVERALHKSGVAFALSCVATPAEFEHALRTLHPDLVLADHRLPGFGGAEALQVVLQVAPRTPFILVTGSIDEETAVEYMRAGAADYILKDRLARIGPAAIGALQRRQMEMQLLQAQKMEAVGRLAGGVAHDFNNVLTAILGYTALLLDGLPSLSPLRPDLEEIRKAADHASALTRQLLAFSRKQVLEMRVLDLNDLVTSTNKLLRRLLGEDVEVVTTLDETLGRVRADAAQLEQVIVNLAVNARDAMPDGGRLAIATRNVELDDAGARECTPVRPGRYALFALSDTGTGMSAETMSRMFEPFFTTKDAGKGTGLGLSTVYGIVQQSGGYLRCSSALGQGTTFEVYLPRSDELAELVPVRVAARAAHGLETVLLVEDDAALRSLMRRVIERYDYTVLAAATAEEASALARDYQGPIHLLLTDVVLPGASGPAFADELRERHTSIKVLFMSGYLDDVVSSRGVVSLDTAFIQKPFTGEALAMKVREVLQ